MSLSDLPKRVVEALGLVLPMAATIEDRTPAEQRALTLLAEQVDRQRNRQTIDNRQPGQTLTNRPPCTYGTDHPKSCPCRGDGRAVEPEGGWSRLAEEVAG